jgi:hypothetical protein|tara:strand:- start:280 stop:837 length:558 start_codon:yes stop_codon:yes gene_type:complete
MASDLPLRIDSALNEKTFLSLKQDLLWWSLSTYSSDKSKKFFMSYHPEDVLPFYNVSIDLKFRFKKHLKKDITLIRIHTNGQVTESYSNFHTDYSMEGTYTAVLFTERKWNTDWGGELVVQNPETKQYHYYAYIPNTVVLFPANWQHCGRSPNRHTTRMRTSIAFSYIETERIKDIDLKSISNLY